MNGNGRKIHVLMVGSDLEHSRGGIVTVVRNYLNYGGWGDVSVRFVATHRDGTVMQRIAIFLKGYGRIRRMLKSGTVDVVHLNMAERGSAFRKALVGRLCLKYGVPYIIHHHGAEFMEFSASLRAPFKGMLIKHIENAGLNIVLYSGFGEYLKRFAPGARVEVMYNAVPRPYGITMRPAAERNFITTLGWLGLRKGTYDLVECIKAIDGRLSPEIRFCLCGNGDVENIKRKIEEYGIGHRIAHVGWADADKKKEILPKTMLHVLPSYNEGLPMSILETMYCGIPNIATPVNGIPSVVIPGKTGILVNPGDTLGLGEAILRLAGDTRERERLGENSIALIEKDYSLKSHAERLKAIYRSLAHRDLS